MNIVLTGMRGSGKSYFGKKIAKFLGYKFLDTDKEIEKQEKLKIPKIVEKHGWKHFRKLENNLCNEISSFDKYVIATGGGLIIDPKNEKLLRKNGKIILLHRDIEKCAKSIINDKKNSRPSLTGRNLASFKEVLAELEELWNKRKKRYHQSADLVIKID